jgi:hypothetical protein
MTSSRLSSPTAPCGRADLSCQGFARVAVPVGDHDLRAVLGEQRNHRAAQALCPAGDDRNLAVQVAAFIHRRSLS